MKGVYDKFDRAITAWFKRHGYNFLKYSLAIVFIWFGALKPFGLSPAQGLVENTVYWFDPSWFVPLLGWWEVAIGVCILFKPLLRLGIGLLALQMAGTFLPLVLLPEVVYTVFPYALTLEGQYIVKNLVLIAAGMIVGSHARDKK